MVSLLMVIALNLRQPGTIDVEALKSIGLYPGPKYQEVKSYDNFEHEGQVYNSMILKDQLNPDQLYPSLVIQNHVSQEHLKILM